ncbi:uncharacterized protein LACBIDRAFT_317265 [Laccaria bicolor S238N-H82]|uniref:SUZ domain-containing protein n=1 Tax=Laccaria bicolor (strain S238N-H82 / ATCC MYA-4686) TaxID=486041 RepID=B0D4S7_LACBS|nr:uncharacterized protein LACBIDRAFT_317265 [Laccaria bicolor S238N-H82]EDR10393.1 hypothetical protein LACBIDRAFT_317265 [Laccaria bicolor S238N-H82]|eukprot:XP_001878843.1 hypothetical protein LACBIDRAFT_317265 [Laccaria bicolor S238N-H82]
MASNNDAWDRPVPSTSVSNTRRPAPPPTPIKDDWEDDDDEVDEEPPSEELNKQIWEHANTKTLHPMPALILTKSPSTHLPPQAAFTQQPSMRILKRPSASTSQSSSASSQPNGAETMKEREKRYHAARERIFGGDTPPPLSPPPTTDKMKPQTQSVVKVVREPRGPASGKQSTSKGFGERKGKPPLNTKPPNANAGEGGRDVS